MTNISGKLNLLLTGTKPSWKGNKQFKSLLSLQQRDGKYLGHASQGRRLTTGTSPVHCPQIPKLKPLSLRPTGTQTPVFREEPQWNHVARAHDCRGSIVVKAPEPPQPRSAEQTTYAERVTEKKEFREVMGCPRPEFKEKNSLSRGRTIEQEWVLGLW